MAENEEDEELQYTPLPKRRWNDVSNANYRTNEITTIVNGSMLMTPKAFESHASLINLACLLFTDAGEAEQEEERRRRREDKDGLD
ncbi:hypothetical protein DY000_02012582 [Brassica cretica]|uniref:Uncharacterized protein n=1 Tax=Brassica cretica TaxID=69181 RepID=A0ABQ7D1F1_BRACR|nr:hypothetical protein DY000_02012582 [Brassica cretica]